MRSDGIRTPARFSWRLGVTRLLVVESCRPQRDRGAVATEYAVLLAFIAVAAGVGIEAFGGSLRDFIEGLAARISAALG